MDILTPDLSQWQNMIYVIPLLVAVVYLVIITFTGAITAGVDVDVDTDADIDTDVDADADVGGFAWADPLTFLGAKKVSLALVIEIFMVLWGTIGLIINEILGNFYDNPVSIVLISVPITIVITSILTRLLAEGIGKIMPKIESDAIKAGSLVGDVGTVRFTITKTGGSAFFTSEKVGSLEIGCRLHSGETDNILPGTKVVFVEYDEDRNVYSAVQYEE